MIDYTIASNSDNRIEAFYVDESGTIMHTWQKVPNDNVNWSEPCPLYGTNPFTAGTNQQLNNATRVECCTDENGQIHMVAHTQDGNYYTCYQSPGFWNGWFQIMQS